jgi:hypothetical protein
MAINRDMLISVGLLILCQVLVWFQANGSLKVEWLRNNIWFLALSGVPITYLYVYANQIGYRGFGNLWAVRLSSFGAGIIAFVFLTGAFFGESILTPKNAISFVLICIVMGIQFFWK